MLVWLLAGLLGAQLLPRPDAPAPDAATRIFGEARSMRSSAPAGVFAFATLLRRLGFVVQPARTAGRPRADVLAMLGPQVELTGFEIDGLLEWVRGGGRLLYSPGVDVVVAPEAGAPPEVLGVADALAQAIVEQALPQKSFGGDASLWRLGRGKVALLDDGAAVLSNQQIRQQGLATELAWLRWLMKGAHTVAFDEARLELSGEGGLLAVVADSRFGVGLRFGLVALLIWLLATGARTRPAQVPPAPGGRRFGEHLEALAGVLADGGRLAIAGELMLAGTRRRLGPLADTALAKAVLQPLEGAVHSKAELVARARSLQALERDLGVAVFSREAADG